MGYYGCIRICTLLSRKHILSLWVDDMLWFVGGDSDFGVVGCVSMGVGCDNVLKNNNSTIGVVVT
jgi:hypothetical protein